MAAVLWGIFTTANLFGFVILFFIFAVAGRQLNNMGLSFNKWFAFMSLVLFFILDKFVSLKWSIFLTLIAGMAAGFVGGATAGGDLTDD